MHRAWGWRAQLVLHAAIVAATLFTWTHKLDIAEQPSQIVPVDLVTVADQTNVAPMVTQAPNLRCPSRT